MDHEHIVNFPADSPGGSQVSTLKRKRNARIPWITAVTLIGAFVVVGSIRGQDQAQKRHDFLVPAREELLRLEDDEFPRRLYPDTQMLRIAVKILKRHNLSAFRDDGARTGSSGGEAGLSVFNIKRLIYLPDYRQNLPT